MTSDSRSPPSITYDRVFSKPANTLKYKTSFPIGWTDRQTDRQTDTQTFYGRITLSFRKGNKSNTIENAKTVRPRVFGVEESESDIKIEKFPSRSSSKHNSQCSFASVLYARFPERCLSIIYSCRSFLSENGIFKNIKINFRFGFLTYNSRLVKFYEK